MVHQYIPHLQITVGFSDIIFYQSMYRKIRKVRKVKTSNFTSCSIDEFVNELILELWIQGLPLRKSVSFWYILLTRTLTRTRTMKWWNITRLPSWNSITWSGLAKRTCTWLFHSKQRIRKKSREIPVIGFTRKRKFEKKNNKQLLIDL